MIELAFYKKLNSPSGQMKLELDLTFEAGTFLSVYGKSGAGKTSILRILAGLLNADAGRIAVNNNLWLETSKGINLKSQKRKVGFLFQDYALFPNMSVEENLRFALEKNGDPKIVSDLIALTELGDLRQHKPTTLSGGQQQRVALARALVRQPELLMLDEPLSALDQEMRVKLQDYILEAHRTWNLTTIMISHDISEIFKMSDQVLMLDEGKMIKYAPPHEVFAQKSVSGKFQFTGEVVGIEKEEVIYIITVLIGKDAVKVVADENEATKLQLGDKVLVASKAFNPIIKKLS